MGFKNGVMKDLFIESSKNLFDNNTEVLLNELKSYTDLEITIGPIGELDIVCLIDGVLYVFSLYKFNLIYENKLCKKVLKPKLYMRDKLLTLQTEGISLVQFFEDEIKYKLPIVLSIIKNKLNLSKRLCGARECTISPIGAQLANRFLDDNHIHGKNYGKKFDLGAFYKGRLVGVMSFRQGNLSRNSHALEMDRFCSLLNYNIPGLASKMFSNFVKYYADRDITTYADLRFTTGNVYNKLGFEFVKMTQTNYFYVVNDKRTHRFSFRKSVLSRKLDKFDPSKTEYENMLENGIDRVWDCGHKKFIWRDKRL